MTTTDTHTTIVVPGIPQPKGSWVAFWSRRDGRCKVRPDNSKKASVWNREIVVEARRAGIARILEGPVAVDIDFYFLRPPGDDKLAIYRAKRPDVDKLCRLVLDALTGLAFADDNQVAALRAIKRYTDSEARAEIRVWPLAQTEAPLLEGLR